MRNILYYIYLALILLMGIWGLYNYKTTNSLQKLIILLLVATGVNELCTVILPYLKINKNPLYHIFSVVEISLTTLYFLKTIHVRKYSLYARLSSILWIVLAIINFSFFQPLHKINSNFLILECVVIISMSIIALYVIFCDDTITNIVKHDLFWVWVCFLVLWAGTFFFWAGQSIINNSPYMNLLSNCQAIINIVIYIGIFSTFFISNKEKQHEYSK